MELIEREELTLAAEAQEPVYFAAYPEVSTASQNVVDVHDTASKVRVESMSAADAQLPVYLAA
jgi:hypothetical protein